MAKTVIMPRQGQSVESCILTKRYIEDGAKVNEGDILFAYETDKASFEEESDVSGVLLKWFYSEGDEISVLNRVCIIGEEGEEVEDSVVPGAEEKGSTASDVNIVEQRIDNIVNSAADIELLRISPRARRMAVKLGIDPKKLKGSGPEGRIIVRDIELYDSTKSDIDSGSPYTVEPLTNIRKIIAKSMFESLQNSAQLTHHLGADARRMLKYRKLIKSRSGETGIKGITINDMVCYSVIKAIRLFPRLNSHLIGDELRLFNSVNLGLAIDTDRGLMVPSVRSTENFSIQELSGELSGVAERCRTGSVDPDILTAESASFTISNLGNYGVEMFTPVINLPQVAILGVNTILNRYADTGDGIMGFVPYIGLSLTYDHRAIDGGEATRFLKQIAIEIENLDISI